MPTKGQLVQGLDECVAPGRGAKVVHFVLRHGDAWCSIGSVSVDLFGYSHGFPFDEFIVNRTFRHWEEHRIEGYSGGPLDQRPAGESTPELANREVNEGSNPPGLNGGTQVNNPGVGTSESLLEREVQRGY